MLLHSTLKNRHKISTITLIVSLTQIGIHKTAYFKVSKIFFIIALNGC